MATREPSTIQLFSDLTARLERGFATLHERFNRLDKDFAVHVAGGVDIQRRLDAIESAMQGEDGIANRVEKLWVVDRVKLWAMRSLVGGTIATAAAVGGYWIRYLMGWGGS